MLSYFLCYKCTKFLYQEKNILPLPIFRNDMYLFLFLIKLKRNFFLKKNGKSQPISLGPLSVQVVKYSSIVTG